MSNHTSILHTYWVVFNTVLLHIQWVLSILLNITGNIEQYQIQYSIAYWVILFSTESNLDSEMVILGRRPHLSASGPPAIMMQSDSDCLKISLPRVLGECGVPQSWAAQALAAGAQGQEPRHGPGFRPG